VNQTAAIATIAYLAPEIPGPSSTFVYNEIFSLENKQNLRVEPFSVHRPELTDKASREVKELGSRTGYLYERSLSQILGVNIRFLLKYPFGFSRALLLSTYDALKSLRSPKLSAGICYRFLVGIDLAWQLKEKSVEHLHIHFAHVPTDIGMYASLASGIPFSVTSHANDIFERGWLIKEKVARSSFFATISEFNIGWLKRYGVDSNKLKVIRCGVDSALFSPRAKKPKSSPVVFGFLGRLVEKKGASVLIAACQQLTKLSTQPFSVELVGEGPLGNELRKQSKELDLDNHVTFLGALPHSDISSWLSGLDYFVLPCVRDSKGDMDGIPVALMEAMLSGVPVISTDVSGVPELVIANETGLVTKAFNQEHLASTMRQAIEEPLDKVDVRSVAAAKLVCSEYDLHNNAKKLADLILCR